MELKSVYLPVETVKRFMYDAFIKLGVPEEDACTSVEILIASDLRGIEFAWYRQDENVLRPHPPGAAAAGDPI